jgi:hypothetical protein
MDGLYVASAVEVDVRLEIDKRLGVWLDGDHATALTDLSRCRERELPDVRANVDHDVARYEQLFDRGDRLRLVRATSQDVALDHVADVEAHPSEPGVDENSLRSKQPTEDLSDAFLTAVDRKPLMSGVEPLQ